MTSERRTDHVVIIQDRSRLYGHGLQMLLQAASRSPVEAVGTPDSLEKARLGRKLHGVVLELEGVPWDVPTLIADLKKTHASVRIVATTRREFVQQRVEGVTVVDRGISSRVILSALNGKNDGSVVGQRVRSEVIQGAETLTSREFQVLALISGGLTTAQIADRLGISSKTVEGKRQSLFLKLGVQNQSAAVSMAIRAGILGAKTQRSKSVTEL